MSLQQFNFSFDKEAIKLYPEYLQNHVARMQLDSLEFGKNPTPRSWFYESADVDWISSYWISQLNNLSYPGKDKIAEWEHSKLGKFAPQGGVAEFSDRLTTFNEYFIHLDKPKVFNHRYWQEAKELAIRRLELHGQLLPCPVEALIKEGLGNDRYNTNSGYPMFLKRKNILAIEEAVRDYALSIDKKFPSTVGSRASMGKTGKAARFIFMSSMAVNLKGQRFTRPLQLHLTNQDDFFMPWRGYDVTASYINEVLHKTKVQHNFATLKDTDFLLFGTDYDKMDQHFNKWHGLETYDVIKHAFPKCFHKELKETILYVFTQPVVTSRGVVFGEHSLLSGSEWTNLIETVFDYILRTYLDVLRMHGDINFALQYSMAIGDDQLYFVVPTRGKRFTEEQIKDVIENVVRIFKLVGMEANMQKQEVSYTETTFLQRMILLTDGHWQIGVYPIIRNLTSQVYPEFWHNEKVWDKYAFALRVMMITENCKYHPLFQDYAKWCYYSNPACAEFMNNRIRRERAIQNSRSISHFLPSYVGSSTIDQLRDEGIESFETFKIWKEMAR